MKFKTFLASIIIILSLFTVGHAEYFTDLIVTSKDGIWTDSRAFSTLSDAITAIGADERTLVITSPQNVTSLTIPANISLRFERNGSINNSDTLTIYTSNIDAANRQVFVGTGTVRFASNATVRSDWFSNMFSVLDLSVANLNIIISSPQTVAALTIPATASVKFERNGAINNSGQLDISTINITAEDKQIFTGTGDIDFATGTMLKTVWFQSLMSALSLTSDDNVVLEISSAGTVSSNLSTGANVRLKWPCAGRAITVSAGMTLTVNSQFDAGMYQIFGGDGTVNLGVSSVKTIYPEWWYDGGGNWAPAINTCLRILFTMPSEGTLRLSRNYTITTPIAYTIVGLSLTTKTIDGRGASLTSGLTTGVMMTITSNSTARHFIIEGLTFIGGASETGGLKLDGGSGALTQYLYGFTVSNVRMNAVKGNGLEITNNTFEGRLVNVDIRNESELLGYGIYLNNAGGDISSINIFGCHTSGYYHGVYVPSPVSDIQIYGGTYILAQREGINLANNQGQGVFGAHVENNWVSAASIATGEAGLKMVGKGVISGVSGTTSATGKQRYIVHTYPSTDNVITVTGGYGLGSTVYYLYNSGPGYVELQGNQTYYSLYGAGVIRRRGQDKQICTTTSTSGTGEDDLKTYTIAANSMGMYGCVKILAAGTKTGSANNKTIKLYFGATAFTVSPAANDTNDWRVEATICNQWVTNAQRISWVAFNGNTPTQDYNTASIDTTAAVTVKLTGECADAGDVINQTMWVVERF